MEPRQATRASVWRVFLLSLLAFAAAAVLLPLAGPVKLDFGRALAGQQPESQILFALRLPRVLLALLTGGALSLSGVLLQALLRNGLATPYTLGVSSGASLGAVIAIAAGLTMVWPAAVAGAVLILLLVTGVASRNGVLSPFTLLMAGISVNSICLAAILFIHSVATFAQSAAITRWMTGSIDSVEPGVLAVVAVAVLPCWAVAFRDARRWNVLAVGDEWAQMRGVPSARLGFTGYMLTSVLTGAVTAVTGPIGFVGLIVPHGMRLWLGADHRILIPSSFLVGGVFLAACDTVARTALAPAEIPVGVITALLGGPFFIWLLRTR